MPIDRSKPRLARNGYVLIAVLAASILVVTSLGTLANISLRRGLEAADAERELQKRWGAQSLQSALLKQAPKVFEAQQDVAAEKKPGVPPPTILRSAVVLGGITFDLLLADEDSKINLNALYHHAGRNKTEQVIASSVGPAATRFTRLVPAVAPQSLQRQSKLRSDDDEDDEPPAPNDAFRSWGEVFDVVALENRMNSDAAIPNVTTGMTCWGSGRLNFRRANDDAIMAIAGSVIQDGPARRLVERYRKNPLINIGVLIESQVTNVPKRIRLNRLLSQVSTNYSLWIHASGEASEPLQRFTVMSLDDEGVTHYHQFAH